MSNKNEKISTTTQVVLAASSFAIAGGTVAGAIVEPQQLINSVLPVHVEITVKGK
ncbi:hypothetical protein F7734_10105 [Scytonema sp. UIC 10036]|uniref:hypothetical protein n=1 Tax=Scytonema sp. UIC 10036 TaxID=2304196 RepID=UPI0012DAD2D6|nr:hypothetical protein [Scytonema sp. UIC 10036]MUG92784.1 hypothetical protein [Scytonema sp. UIC 10036]